MAGLPILLWPDPRLSKPCAPVGCEDVSGICKDMLQSMYAASGRGLAAPQVGVMLRIFVMDLTWKDGNPDPHIMINPQIWWRSTDVVTGPEGCLSIPGVIADVARPKSIRLAWTDETGRSRDDTLTGFAAVCAQHEYDHLDGVVTFDRVSAARRQAIEAAYLGGQPA
ncbi:MAG: peptide deformylase [Paracoccaceae bacterium]